MMTMMTVLREANLVHRAINLAPQDLPDHVHQVTTPDHVHQATAPDHVHQGIIPSHAPESIGTDVRSTTHGNLKNQVCLIILLTQTIV